MFSNKLVRNILIKPLYNHFTAGESIKTLQSKIVQLNTQKLYPIADYIKEFSYNKDDIKKSFNEYLNLAAVKELSRQDIPTNVTLIFTEFCNIVT